MRRSLFWGVVILLLAALPPVAAALGHGFYVDLVRRIMIFAIAAVSLNLILGYGGMVSFGHAAYLGIGGYSVAIFAFYGVNSGPLQWAVAIGASALVALAIGAVSIRTSGVYFIMITLAFTQMLYYLGISIEEYGGDDGIRLKTRSQFPLLDLNDPLQFYYLVLALLLLSVFIVHRLVNSRFGMVLRAARSNEARSAGPRLLAIPLPPDRVRDRRRHGRARRRAARQPGQLPHPGIHALDALGRDHVHGDPGRHGHQRRPGARLVRLPAARGHPVELARPAVDRRALAGDPRAAAGAGGALLPPRPRRDFCQA
jgi:hypothetical protein